MSDYIICLRNVKQGRFGNDPGKTYFLKISKDADTYKPENSISKSDWLKETLKNATSGINEITNNDCGDILVFIHGYNNSKKTVLKRHRQISENLKATGYKGAVVSFDWPSNDQALNYLEDRSDAKKTAIKLVDDCIKIFATIQSANCEINMHLLAHSTGAYVVREAFDDADDRPRVAAENWTVSQILFIGADISAESLSINNPKSSSLYRHCVRLTNYYNPFDSALKLSSVKRIGVSPRLGRVGLPANIPEKAVNINCGAYYDENQGMMDAIGTKSHSWYMQDKLFLKDMHMTLRGDLDRNVIPTRRMDADGALALRKES